LVLGSFGVRGSAFRSWFTVRGCGTRRESAGRMAVARRYEELEVWQLADALKLEVYALIATEPAARDFEFCRQIRESAASTTKNICEGFGRFQAGDFARFMEIAVASAMETKESLKDGVDRGYFTPGRVSNAQHLVERTIKCSIRFISYLKSSARKRRARGSQNHEQT
jgi:four helix bundle protein